MKNRYKINGKEEEEEEKKLNPNKSLKCMHK